MPEPFEAEPPSAQPFGTLIAKELVLMRLPAATRRRPTLKRLVERGASRLGYEVIPSWRLKAFEHARHLRRLFGQLDIDTVLDVGANDGGYRELLRDFVGFRRARGVV